MNISEDLYFPVLVTDETLGAHYCRDERINNSRKFVVMKIANYKDDEETLFVVFYNYEGRAIKGYYMDEKIVWSGQMAVRENNRRTRFDGLFVYMKGEL